MTHLFLDCRLGIGGDMFLAAAAGLGLDLAPLQKSLNQAGLEVTLDAPQTRVHGLAGRRLEIDGPSTKQPLRHLPDILAIIDKLPLPAPVRHKSAAAFKRLAEVEAKMHAVDPSQVHFHEVGAVDTIIDVVGAFHALDTLEITHVACSPLPWFNGTVTCQHGTLPLPAPATLELMRGKPVFPTDLEIEIITPTGALIVDQITTTFTTGPTGTITNTATAFGTHNLPTPGGLRLITYTPNPDLHQEA